MYVERFKAGVPWCLRSSLIFLVSWFLFAWQSCERAAKGWTHVAKRRKIKKNLWDQGSLGWRRRIKDVHMGSSHTPPIWEQECSTPSLRPSSSLNDLNTQNLTCIKFGFIADESSDVPRVTSNMVGRENVIYQSYLSLLFAVFWSLLNPFAICWLTLKQSANIVITWQGTLSHFCEQNLL